MQPAAGRRPGHRIEAEIEPVERFGRRPVEPGIGEAARHRLPRDPPRRGQRGVTIDYRVIGGADHFFNEHLDVLTGHMEDYLDKHYVPVGGDAED